MEGNPALRPQNRRSQISSTPNSPFRPNSMPAMRPPCGISWQKRPNKTQPQGLNGRSTIRLPGHRRHAHHFTRQTATRADPRTRSQAARATFPRTQALSISTARPRQHSQHFEHQAFPTSPTRPQAAHRRHARQAASRIPNSMSTKPPTPCQPNPNATFTRHFAFSRKSSRTFPCRGQDARTAARPKRIPRRKRSPPWSSKHLNAATATKFSTKNTPPRCCGPYAPTAEAERIRTRPR